MINFKFTLIDDNGEETEHTIPGMYEICPNCRGKGTHVNRAIDGHGISPEEFREDPEFFDDYMSGTYDVPCEDKCDDGKVIRPDEENLDNKQIALLKKLEEQEYEMYLHHQECEAERRAGC